VSEENKQLLRRWMEEVWHQNRRETIEELLDEKIVMHGLTDKTGKPLDGISGFLDFHSDFRGAFPNIRVTVDEVIGEGDLIAGRCSVTGQHTGDSLGVAPTQASVEFNGIVMARIHDGKFVEVWNSFDFLKMNQQLGIA
jgi:predicted ester cyclase